jgi:hypothetical protein
MPNKEPFEVTIKWSLEGLGDIICSRPSYGDILIAIVFELDYAEAIKEAVIKHLKEEELQ